MCRSRGHIVNAFGEEASLSIIRMYSRLSHSIGRYYIAKQVRKKRERMPPPPRVDGG